MLLSKQGPDMADRTSFPIFLRWRFKPGVMLPMMVDDTRFSMETNELLWLAFDKYDRVPIFDNHRIRFIAVARRDRLASTGCLLISLLIFPKQIFDHVNLAIAFS